MDAIDVSEASGVSGLNEPDRWKVAQDGLRVGGLVGASLCAGVWWEFPWLSVVEIFLRGGWRTGASGASFQGSWIELLV